MRLACAVIRASVSRNGDGPKGTQFRLVISHGGATFSAVATVIYPQPNMGMGVEFSTVEPEQLEVLVKWLKEVSAK
jgi:hypothetical protein